MICKRLQRFSKSYLEVFFVFGLKIYNSKLNVYTTKVILYCRIICYFTIKGCMLALEHFGWRVDALNGCLRLSFRTQLKTLHPINCPSVNKLCYSIESLDSTVVRLLNCLGRIWGREERKNTPLYMAYLDWDDPWPLHPERTPSALSTAGRHSQVLIRLPHLLLVPSLHQAKHHLGQGVSSTGSPLGKSLFAVVGVPAPHTADEVSADLPLGLAHLKRQAHWES